MRNSTRQLFSVVVLVLMCSIVSAQDITGYWEGMLRITPSDSLTIGLWMEQDGDSLRLSLDSPDQYTMDIPATSSSWQDSTLKWSVADISAAFTGRLAADGKHIAGTLKQFNKSLPLTLERGHERKTINRPQTPQPPYPYREEEIGIKEKGGRYNLINGTLTMPEGTPKALVILITGSGWQDRDETLMGHKPFRVIADHLTRNGYAVFRYDDYPQAVFTKSTTFDFADGVVMILDSFSRRQDLAPLTTGLLGHSEGSQVAEIVAARDKRVQFVVTIGGVAQKNTDVLLYQVRAINEVSGKLTPEEIDNSVVLSDAVYRAVGKTKDPKQAAAVLRQTMDRLAEKLTAEEQERYGMTLENRRAQANQMSSPWFFNFIRFNPKSYIKKMRCPVLAIGGEKDLQVDAVANNQLFAKYLPKNRNHKFVVLENANHLLQTCTTGSPEEYGAIEETIQPKALEIITEWMEGIRK